MGKRKTKAIPTLSTVQINEFLQNKIKLKNNCWKYAGYIRGDGYGVVIINGKNFVASRIAWIIRNGKIPKKLFVCHKCDNRSCVNPSHLFLGTNKDNMIDCANKKRLVNTKKTKCMRGHPLSGANLYTYMRDNRLRRNCKACKVLLRRNRSHTNVKAIKNHEQTPQQSAR